MDARRSNGELIILMGQNEEFGFLLSSLHSQRYELISSNPSSGQIAGQTGFCSLTRQPTKEKYNCESKSSNYGFNGLTDSLLAKRGEYGYNTEDMGNKTRLPPKNNKAVGLDLDAFLHIISLHA